MILVCSLVQIPRAGANLSTEHLSMGKPMSWAVVVAQLVKRSLPTPKVRSSNPFISKLNIEHLFSVNCIQKTKIKKKGREWPLLKNSVADNLDFH